MMRAAVFLDRDGVIDRLLTGADGVPRPPSDLPALALEDGVEVACRRLKAAGLALIVVTNQPDVARGTQTREVVESINAALMRQLPLDAVEVCYHDDGDGCECRKPNPGMLTRAAQRCGIELSRSFMVGDRWRDVEAGQRAGCTTILVGARRDREAVEHGVVPDYRAPRLVDAVGWMLARTTMGR